MSGTPMAQCTTCQARKSAAEAAARPVVAVPDAGSPRRPHVMTLVTWTPCASHGGS